jgi:nucleotide-binding universal stress UspA family protein
MSSSELPITKFKNILYVTDLSESGRQAFPCAAMLAKCSDARLTVFHVVDVHQFDVIMGYVNDALWKEFSSSSLEEARQILMSRKRDNVEILRNAQQTFEQKLADSPAAPVVSYEVKVEIGEPLEMILQEAHEGGYDLLVISKHGDSTSVRDAVIGNTVRRVVRRCRIPVLVVPVDE